MTTSLNTAKTISPDPKTLTHIAGYQFTSLTNLEDLRITLLEKCQSLNLLGTILLSTEGINIGLAGAPEDVQKFRKFLSDTGLFQSIDFHETQTSQLPFKYLKVKIKQEIITMRTSKQTPEVQQAPYIAPSELKKWLDEKRDITLLDSRNDYEVRFGTFENAINPNINNFSAFVAAAELLDPEKPIVTFCTGGVRCEKAALFLLEKGFKEVYQLEKGILNYFKEVGEAHFEGECFVFDQRIAVNSKLEVTGTQQCKICQGPVKDNSSHACKL